MPARESSKQREWRSDHPPSALGGVRDGSDEALISIPSASKETPSPVAIISPHDANKTNNEADGADVVPNPRFDVTLLGLGADGHTASLLPGEPVLEERHRWVAAVSRGRPEIRITMTYPAIDSSRRAAFLVTGREKAAILRAVRAGNSGAPASRVRPVGELIWFADQAATTI